MTNSMLENLSDVEKEAFTKIMQELANSGKSDSFNALFSQDWDEIPVDIDTFIHEKKYLGNALYDSEGRYTLFPYWEKKLKEIFPTNTTTAINTLVLTGAIGLGKTMVAVICILYMLYRLLCLRDPYLFYGLQPIDKISISFLNITIDAAKGVGCDKFNQMILSSEWFMSHGEMRGTTNLEYVPNKHIEIIVGSSNNQVIGRAIFCLAGDTIVETSEGDRSLESLEGKEIYVKTLSDAREIKTSSKCIVKKTVQSFVETVITLEDDTIIHCTPNHELLLEDGSYKSVYLLNKGEKIFNSSIKEISNGFGLKQYYDVINCKPFHNFLIKTNSGYIVSHNCNLADEVNYSVLTNNVEAMKKKQLTLITQIDARMRSRFMRGTYLPTLNILCSSKQSEQSFLDSYINNKKKNESKTTLIVDEPQWVVDSRKDSPIHFFVAIGNKFLANELLPLDASKELVDEYKAKGYSIIEVPIGYLEVFQDNLDGALTDIAGIATTSSLKYMSGIRWNEIKTDKYKNPFSQEVLEIGTSKDDSLQYQDFFDLNLIPKEIKSKPLYIHLDLSKTGDKTGISGVFAVGKSPKIEGQDSSKEMFYQLGFHVAIKAPKGYEISFDKHRSFIRWLRAQGLKIKSISFDTYQSSMLQQLLQADNFNVKTISVDRLDPESKTQLQYAYFKSTVYDRRLIVYKECSQLTEEVLGLERESDGHIQHPENGTQGSKDICDSLVGALWNASLHADEFAYEYGETFSAASSINDKDENDIENLLKSTDGVTIVNDSQSYFSSNDGILFW